MAESGELTEALLWPSSGRIPGSTLLHQSLACLVLWPELELKALKRQGTHSLASPAGGRARDSPCPLSSQFQLLQGNQGEDKKGDGQEPQPKLRTSHPRASSCQHRASIEAARAMYEAGIPATPTIPFPDGLCPHLYMPNSSGKLKASQPGSHEAGGLRGQCWGQSGGLSLPSV